MNFNLDSQDLILHPSLLLSLTLSRLRIILSRLSRRMAERVLRDKPVPTLTPRRDAHLTAAQIFYSRFSPQSVHVTVLLARPHRRGASKG
jgi:hypothetical protein